MSAEALASDSIAESAPKPYSAALVGDMLRLFDAASILVVGLAIYFVYVYPSEPHTASRYFVTLLVATIMAGSSFHWLGAYTGDFLFARGLRCGRMLSALAVTFALLLSIAFAMKVSNFYSRVWVVTWFLSSATLLSLARFYLDYLIRRLASSGRFANRTVIVGTGAQADRLAIHLAEHDAVRTRILGFVDDGLAPGGQTNRDHGILGGIDDLIRLVRDDRVDQVFIALPWNRARHLRQVTQRLATTPVVIRLAPDLAGFEFPYRNYAQVAGLPMLPLFDRPISGWSQLAKAIEDRVLAVLALFLLWPVLISIGLAIRLTSSGPVLFKQKRYGFNNHLIEIWKFRTMYHHLTDHNADKLATKDDARVTPIGKFLRRMSFDELPQLFNVLSGEMSLVGPRPHAIWPSR